MKRLFFDLETGGTDPKKSGIHQLAGLIEIDGVVVEEFDIKLGPMKGKEYSNEALALGGLTISDLNNYPDPSIGYNQFIGILSKYVNKFDKKDKMFLGGWNNAYFDNSFLRQFFEDFGNSYFGSWFWSVALDVQILAQYDLRNERANMPNFKLETVVAKYGLEVEGAFHDGLYDIRATYQIFKHITEE